VLSVPLVRQYLGNSEKATEFLPTQFQLNGYFIFIKQFPLSRLLTRRLLPVAIAVLGVIAAGVWADQAQYHRQTSQNRDGSAVLRRTGERVIPRRGGEAVSRSFAISIHSEISQQIVKSNGQKIRRDLLANRSTNLDESGAAAQYRGSRSRFRLLIGVGVALAVLYLAFLGVWYWATRVRPRAIDTNRRML
jgi:hypothetical protein